jgi:hypothetical protein
VLHKKKGVHPLSTFEQTLKVNTVGSFNVLRLAAEAMSLNEVRAATLVYGRPTATKHLPPPALLLHPTHPFTCSPCRSSRPTPAAA